MFLCRRQVIILRTSIIHAHRRIQWCLTLKNIITVCFTRYYFISVRPVENPVTSCTYSYIQFTNTYIITCMFHQILSHTCPFDWKSGDVVHIFIYIRFTNNYFITVCFTRYYLHFEPFYSILHIKTPILIIIYIILTHNYLTSYRVLCMFHDIAKTHFLNVWTIL